MVEEFETPGLAEKLGSVTKGGIAALCNARGRRSNHGYAISAGIADAVSRMGQLFFPRKRRNSMTVVFVAVLVYLGFSGKLDSLVDTYYFYHSFATAQ